MRTTAAASRRSGKSAGISSSDAAPERYMAALMTDSS